MSITIEYEENKIIELSDNDFKPWRLIRWMSGVENVEHFYVTWRLHRGAQPMLVQGYLTCIYGKLKYPERLLSEWTHLNINKRGRHTRQLHKIWTVTIQRCQSWFDVSMANFEGPMNFDSVPVLCSLLHASCTKCSASRVSIDGDKCSTLHKYKQICISRYDVCIVFTAITKT